MRSTAFLVFVGFLASQVSRAQIPAGEIVGPRQLTSTIYPGTIRNYWVYVPHQYEPGSPACLMVVQDGLGRATGWRLPQVMDSLIAAHSIPVMIGVFVDPGTMPTEQEGAFPRYNRSLEYDALGDRYANFLLRELLPEVEKTYAIKSDPDSRGIAGASSGAICAFNVAWERPDQFRRVLSTIGTYVGLRGGDEFTTLVRKTEAKPIRVFLEDGSNDLNIYAGDWWAANQAMLSALLYSGYEVNYRWGTGGHDSKHAATIMGEAMAWLWKDYPAPVGTHHGTAPRLDLLLENESWNEIDLKGARAHHLTADHRGNILFVDNGRLIQVDDKLVVKVVGEVPVQQVAAAVTSLIGWVKDSRKLVTIDPGAKTATLAAHVDAEYLSTTAKGVYFSDAKQRRIGYYDFTTKSIRYFATEFIPAAMAISSEKTLLTVGAEDSPFGYSFKMNADGTLQYGQPYVHYHVAYGATTPHVHGMDVDSANVLYTATDLGIQVSDQLGRVNFIFSKPTSGVDDVKLVGDRLYVAGDGKVFVRKIRSTGIRSFGAPIKPPKPQL